MQKLIICFAALVALVVSDDCVPAQANWYWTTPCSGQTFTNQLVATNIVATQNGKPVDDQGGIDATLDLVVTITFKNNYGKTVSNPLADIGFSEYETSLGSSCKWVTIPTLGFTNNLNACDLLDNCHLDNPPNPTSLTVTVNIDNLAQGFKTFLNVNSYYGITITFKDGPDNKLACFYIQDKLIKK